MTENDACAWVLARYGEKAIARLEAYQALLMHANDKQNLVAASTIPSIWSRHFVDSAQLVEHAPEAGMWMDVGSGAGLPGLVVALLTSRPVLLIEPRRMRAEFLLSCRYELGLEDQVSIAQCKAQNVAGHRSAAVISARAVASLGTLLEATRHLADAATTYVLPKGVSAQSEVAATQCSWHGTFHVKQSIIDPAFGIVVATAVARR